MAKKITKKYIANQNGLHWDAENDCRLFKSKVGEEIETDNKKIQARCKELGFEEIKIIEILEITDAPGESIVTVEEEIIKKNKKRRL